jgi:hypothetical protein
MFSSALMPFVQALLRDNPRKYIRPANTQKVITYLTSVFLCTRRSKITTIPSIFMEMVPPELAPLVSEVAHDNALGRISVEIFKQLINGAFAPSTVYEMPVLLLFFADLVICGTIDEDVMRLLVLLLSNMEDRSNAFLRALELIPEYCTEIASLNPKFFPLFISHISNELASHSCSNQRFALLIRILALIMIATLDDSIFQCCFLIMDAAMTDPLHKAIITESIIFVIVHRGKFDGSWSLRNDLTLFAVRDPEPVLGLALNGDHFIVQPSGATGSCVYSVRPTNPSLFSAPKVQIASPTIGGFLQTPGSAFLLGLGPEVSATADAPPLRKLVDASPQARPAEIAVIYVGPRHGDQLAIPWDQTSSSFHEFVSSLGSYVEDPDPVLVWQNHYYKVVFEVAPLLQSVVSDADRSAFMDRRVAIVWVDHHIFPPLDFFSERTAVVIFVQPTDSALFVRVAVMKREKSVVFGIVDRPIVVARSFVPFIVRWTAIFAAAEIADTEALNEEGEAGCSALGAQIPLRTPMPFSVF